MYITADIHVHLWYPFADIDGMDYCSVRAVHEKQVCPEHLLQSHTPWKRFLSSIIVIKIRFVKTKLWINFVEHYTLSILYVYCWQYFLCRFKKKKKPWFLMIQINLTMLKKRSNCKTQGRVKIEKFGMAVILYTRVHVNTFKLYMSFQWCRCFVNLFVSLEYKKHLPPPFL